MARRLSLPGPTSSELVPDLAALGLLIRNRRLALALRIDDAAHACGVTASVLSRLENGISVGADRVFLVIRGLGLSLLVTTKQDGQALRSLTIAELISMRGESNPPGESNPQDESEDAS